MLSTWTPGEGRPAALETMRTRGGGPAVVKLGRRVVYRHEAYAWT